MTFVIDKKGQTYKTIDISVSDGKISKICEPIEHKKNTKPDLIFHSELIGKEQIK